MRSFVLFSALVSCATADADPYSSPTNDAARDTAVVSGDSALDDSATTDTSMTDSAMAEDSGPCKLVINELQTGDGASGNADFVEIYNACGSSKSLADYKLVYRSSAGTTDTPVYAFPGATLASKGFYLVGGTGFTGSKDGALASGLAVGGGSIGLRDATGALVDSVGYGSASGALVEGSAAPAPGDTTPAKSLARKPNGSDSDNNATDFKLATPTPGAAN